MTLILWILYPLAIQYERGGWWRLCYIVAIPALIVDVIANHTELWLAMWEWPKRGEWTFSQRLNRLVTQEGWRGDVARYLAKILNSIAPSGAHIRRP